MANHPFMSQHTSQPALLTSGTDIPRGEHWVARLSTDVIVTVLDNRGPALDRTVFWKDQRGGQGVTSLKKFIATFERIPSAIDLYNARQTAAAQFETARVARAVRRNAS